MSDIKIIPADPEWIKTDSRMDRIIAGDIRLRSYYHLDGGGGWIKDCFADIIAEKGKKEYQRGFEWCSGFGIIGFELLGRGQCAHMTFSDYYDVAIKDCICTARRNNLIERVNGYITERIATIPYSDKWDLVLGNPPHAFGLIDRSRKTHAEMETSALENVLRIISDEGMATHKEFFTNIKNHLLPDADIFLYEPGVCVPFILGELEFIRKQGIELISQYAINDYLPEIPDGIDIDIHKDGMIMHFKELR